MRGQIDECEYARPQDGMTILHAYRVEGTPKSADTIHGSPLSIPPIEVDQPSFAVVPHFDTASFLQATCQQVIQRLQQYGSGQ